MKIKGKERVGFNFKDLLISFTAGNDINNDDLEKQLIAIRQQENSSAIAELEKATDPTRFSKGNKVGRKRKSEVNVKTFSVKQAETKEATIKIKDYEER